MKALRHVRPIFILGSVIAALLAGSNLPRLRIASRATPVVRADGGCSLASLNGPYAVEGQGTVLPPALGLSAPAPFGEATIAHFNGAGAFFGSATVNVGGAVATPTFTGTYTVNSDCTGTVTVNVTSLGLTLHNAIVVIGGGQRVIETETDPFAVIQRRAERLED